MHARFKREKWWTAWLSISKDVGATSNTPSLFWRVGQAQRLAQQVLGMGKQTGTSVGGTWAVCACTGISVTQETEGQSVLAWHLSCQQDSLLRSKTNWQGEALKARIAGGAEPRVSSNTRVNAQFCKSPLHMILCLYGGRRTTETRSARIMLDLFSWGKPSSIRELARAWIMASLQLFKAQVHCHFASRHPSSNIFIWFTF